MPARLIDSLATSGALADIFSDASVLQAMLDFEVALAEAEAELGIVPKPAADTIREAAQAAQFDIAKLIQETLRAGTPSIPVVKALTERVHAIDPSAAGFVHWGTTSQDVSDTGLVLLVKKAVPILLADCDRLDRALMRLSDEHRDTVMLGRTLLQGAPPITFGLKCAGWLGTIRRSRVHLESAFAESLVVQFGGASGTLAALGSQGIKVGGRIGELLGLGFPDAPWHAHRDRLASLVVACGVITGCLGKMARDISLLMQEEVGEASEPSGEGRGGSSTMPQKHNPIGCALTLASANRVPGLVAAFLAGMVQEHERAVGGLQSEASTVSAVIQATGLAVASMAEVAEAIEVNKTRMRENIADTRGTVFAERASMLLAGKVGRPESHRLIAEAARKSNTEKRPLGEVLDGMHEVGPLLGAKMLRHLDVPEEYLGVADEFRVRLIAGSERSDAGKKKE